MKLVLMFSFCFLICLLICGCQQRGLHYTDYKEAPLQLQECNNWDDLLAQPLICLNSNTSVHLGIHRGGSDDLGIVELLCLEISTDAQAAQRTDCNFEGSLGPFDVSRELLSDKPEQAAFERALNIIDPRINYQLHTSYVLAHKHGLMGNGSGYLSYGNQKLAQWTHSFEQSLFSWFHLYDPSESQELEQLLEDKEPIKISARSELLVAYAGNAEEALIMVADEKELYEMTFPSLAQGSIEELQVTALPGEKFLFQAQHIIDNCEFLDHLLLKVWINGELYKKKQFTQDKEAMFMFREAESYESLDSPIELQVASKMWGVNENDLVQVQFLYNVNRNTYDFEQKEYIIEDLMQIFDGSGLFVSKVLELQK